MKNLVLPLLILLCILAGVVFLVTNTPLCVNMLLPQFVNERIQDVRIEDFHCRQQTSSLPDILVMKQVTMTLHRGDREFHVSAREITLHNFLEFIRDHAVLRLSAKGLEVQTQGASVVGGQLKTVVHFQDWKPVTMDGAAFAQIFRIGVYRFQKISGHFSVNPKKSKVFDVDGEFYGGNIKGQVDIDQQPHFEYVLWSEFQGVKAQDIQAPYPEFFAKIQGGVSGSARVVGGEFVDIFTVILRNDQQVLLPPTFFLKMDGVFDDDEMAQLKTLDESGAFLKAREAMLHVQNSRNHRIMMEFHIVEDQNNFVLEGRFPLKWDEGFETFLFPQEGE